MKLMGVGTFVLSLFGFCLVALADGEIPKGFEKPIIDKVMKGEIVATEEVATQTEYRVVFRAYFNKVSPEAYTTLATNYTKYPDLFPEILESKKMSEDTTKLESNYWLHMLVEYGIFTFDVYPEGTHKAFPAKDTKSEAKLVNEITNYKDMMKKAVETTRMIPYQTGFLMEDTVEVELVKQSAQGGVIKKKLVDQFKSFLTGFRKELGGDKL